MPSTRKIYRLVIFDIDGTITRHVSSWRYMHERLGIWDALAERYQERFLKGEITYRRFCELDASHWKGMRTSEIRKIFKEVPYSKNVVRCLRRMKRLGLRLAAISTGLQFVADRVKDEPGFDYVLSNRLLEKNGVLTGRVRIKIGHGAKGALVERLARRFGVRPRQMICVGDSDGDIPLARRCGYSIAFNCTSRRLAKISDYVCRTMDFKEIEEVIEKVAA
jgi:phosphoserine phosphatase